MRRRGFTVVQMLVGIAVCSVVGLGAFRGGTTLWKMHKLSVGMPGVQDDAKSIALTLAGALRRATLCGASDSGCTLDAAVEAAGANGVTVYRRNRDGTLSKVVYGLEGGKFMVDRATMVQNATFTLTFYAGSAYYSSSLTDFTPTASTTKTLAAVGIEATVARDGLSGTYTTLVRLRNSPKKAASE